MKFVTFMLVFTIAALLYSAMAFPTASRVTEGITARTNTTSIDNVGPFSNQTDALDHEVEGVFGMTDDVVAMESDSDSLTMRLKCQTSYGSPMVFDVLAIVEYFKNNKGCGLHPSSSWHCENKMTYGSASVSVCGYKQNFPCSTLTDLAKRTAKLCHWNNHVGGAWFADDGKSTINIYHS